jgi:hypothetical protein
LLWPLLGKWMNMTDRLWYIMIYPEILGGNRGNRELVGSMECFTK